ncbi:MAG: hypothetical protein ABI433_16135, partial [Burkholderiaceae bacterium]
MPKRRTPLLGSAADPAAHLNGTGVEALAASQAAIHVRPFEPESESDADVADADQSLNGERA